MKVIVGLGNMGLEYEQTRHNIGFMLADELKDYYNMQNWSNKFSSLYSKGKVANEDVYIIKPQTYVNLSGIAVRKIVDFYKLSSKDVIVLHDDLGLPFARLRYKLSGGHGGHNGLRDCDKHIGTEYYRLRYGIDHPNDRRLVSNYVLSKFTSQEMETNKIIIKAIVENFHLLLNDKMQSHFFNEIAKSSAQIQ